MRMFWSIFFLGSMLLVGLDVAERRQTATPGADTADVKVSNDPWGAPTPNP